MFTFDMRDQLKKTCGNGVCFALNGNITAIIRRINGCGICI